MGIIKFIGEIFGRKRPGRQPASQPGTHRYHAIRDMSFQESEDRFIEKLAAGDYTCIPSDIGLTDWDELGDITAAFFKRYGKVEVKSPPGTGAFAQPMSWPPGARDLDNLNFIGMDAGDAVVSMKSQDGIYLLDSSDVPADLADPDFPTLYHWLLFVSNWPKDDD